MPWNTFEIDDGRLRYCCACSPPMKSSAISRLAKKMPTGFSRPTKATMIAAKPYPLESLSVSCPAGPDTSAMPAMPAAAPPTSSPSQIVPAAENPA